MTHTSKKERGTSAKSAMLSLVMLMLVSLFTVGCGDSNEDFVFTGNNGNAVPTGNVTFQFAKAQNIATVPTATTRLLFTFFDSSGQRTGNAADVPFANSVTLAVPTAATRATVQAINAQGATISLVNFTFTVVQGQTTTATVSGGGTTGTTTGNTTGTTTGNTTGSTTGTTTGNTTGTTTGNTTGTTTGNTTGTTTGNTTGTTTGNTTGGTPARLEVSPATITIAPGGFSGPIQARFFPANSTTPTLVPFANLTVSFENAVPAGTADRYQYLPGTGQIWAQQAVAPNAVPAEGSTVVARVVAIVNGTQVAGTIAITVNTNAANLVTSARIISVNGNSLRLTTGSNYPIVIEETLGSGATQIVPANAVRFGMPTTAGQYTVTSSGASATYADMAGQRQLSFAAVGSANVTFTRNNTAPALGAAVVLTLATTTSNTSDLVDPPAFQLGLTIPVTTGRVNETLGYRADIRYKGGATQDVTPVVGLGVGIGSVPTANGALAAGGVTRGFILLPGTPGTGSAAINALTQGTNFGGLTTFDANPVSITATP